MKTKEIAQKYKIETTELERFARIYAKDIPYSEKLTGMVVPDEYVDELVKQFNQRKVIEKAKKIIEQEEKIEAERIRRQAELTRKQEEENKRKALQNMLISSGFSFEGYKIVKYSGYISGDDVIQVDRGSIGLFSRGTNVGQALTDSLVKIRRRALQELKEAAYDLGCNAVIGVDFDYITLDPQTANLSGGTTYQPYVFCVTANGNAVVIEKIEE